MQRMDEEATASDGAREYVGTVLAQEPNRMYSVRLRTGAVVAAHVGTDLRMKIVRLIPGSRVVVKLSDIDSSRGRIVQRLPPGKEQGT